MIRNCIICITIICLCLSCRISDISGKYINCLAKCNTLTINEDYTFNLELTFADIIDTVKGQWTLEGNYLVLKPKISKGIWIVTEDSSWLIPNHYQVEVREVTYSIKRNKLIEMDEGNEQKGGCFYKLSSDTLKWINTINKSKRKNCNF